MKTQKSDVKIISIHSLYKERNVVAPFVISRDVEFQSILSIKRETQGIRQYEKAGQISIHSLYKERNYEKQEKNNIYH